MTKPFASDWKARLAIAVLVLAPFVFGGLVAVANLLAAMPTERVAVRPDWERMTLTGYISTEERIQLFGEGRQKQFYLVTWQGDVVAPLWFASDDDYDQAEKNTGMLMEVRLVRAMRGHSECYVVEWMRLKK